MGSTPHYFIAIALPEALQDYLSLLQDELQSVLPYKQWYHNKDLHITLKFLGAVEEDKLRQLIQELTCIEQLSAFQLDIRSIGTFGNPKKPRVMWTGVTENERLLQLYESVEEAAKKCGFTTENRKYRPHITLAKRWNTREPVENIHQVLQKINDRYSDVKKLLVDEINLFRIYPGQEPKYKSVATFRLKQ